MASEEEEEQEEEAAVKLMLIVLSQEAVQGFHEQVPLSLVTRCIYTRMQHEQQPLGGSLRQSDCRLAAGCM